ncbi:MAG: GTPase ObgE [Solirubrobacterales bacterium]
MFIDHARIQVRSGDGGNGSAAFRREKYVPEGGPAGGDGGRGGDVVFLADANLQTLMDFRYRRQYKADRGEHGQSKGMHGANAEPLIIRVPAGTIVKNADTGEVIADLVEPGQSFVVAKGGRGGRGNARFSNATNRAPSFAEKGAPGHELWLQLELKLLADVGLVGFPNAGKSTLISRISAARPKIADYPFTTLIPNLGVVQIAPGETFVVADIPGLIEGAHEGIGLGHEFLRHIERTRVLTFVLDCSGETERDPIDDYRTLCTELELFRPDLAARARIIAANKMDAPESSAIFERLKEHFVDQTIELFPISALTGEGLQPLVHRLWVMLGDIPKIERVTPEVVVTRFKDAPAFVISREDGVLVISGERIERLVTMTNLENDEALARFQRTIDRMGLNQALRAEGVAEGDLVRIGELEFEYRE